MRIERSILSPAASALGAPEMALPVVLVAEQYGPFSGLGPVGIALVIAFLVITLGLHEAAHGWVALQCGDPTARDLGRISLNPLVHIDPFMTVLLPAILFYFAGFIFGGAKPVPVAYHRLRNPLRDMMLVALAGPLTNFLAAIFFLAAYKAAVEIGPYGPEQVLPRVLFASMYVNVLLAVFNLIPVPPLDGSRVMRWLLPQSLREPYDVLERFGILIVVLLFYAVPGFSVFLGSGLNAAYRAIDFLTGGSWS